jgi:ornithine carbamoyltransferase
VATPAGEAYQCPEAVWKRVKELDCEKDIEWTSEPREAVKGADVVITDTWFVSPSSAAYMRVES